MTDREEIIATIDRWCQENYYTDFLVTLSLDGEVTTEYLDSDFTEFLWLNDWDEGQKEVKLLGFAPVDTFVLRGAPKNKKSSMTNADRIRAMTDEELAALANAFPCPPTLVCGCRNDCVPCWLDWLREEAEE